MAIYVRILTSLILGVGLTAGATAKPQAADREIAKIFETYAKPGQPGCAVGVMQDGKLAYASAFGSADLEQGRPLDSYSEFNLASVSKQFTAFALLLLEQQGKLSLDDPLVRYVPELDASAPGVTLRHLLHHTGGLRDYIGLLTLQGRKEQGSATAYEALDVLARQQAPDAKPGVAFDYSNTGFFLLGVVIERVSGQTLVKFAEDRIFRPLGMDHTYFVDRYPVRSSRVARGYMQNGDSFDVDESVWEQTGDGQVHTNVHDLALWDENFYTAKVGGKAVIGRMLETGSLNSGERFDYAAGLRIGEFRGLPTVSHTGSWAGYRAALLRFPQQHFSVAVLCNREDAEAIAFAESIAEVYLREVMRPASAAASPEETLQNVTATSGWQPGSLARFAGAYYSAEAKARCVLVERDAALVLESCDDGRQLRPGKPGEFVAAGDSYRLRFPVDADAITGFDYDGEGLHGLHFNRVDAAPTLIINASIVDGSGAPARRGAVRIAGDRIVAVGALQPAAGERIVDAGGLTLAPGFIDTHSHHDRELFEQREALAAVSQGVTTIVVGQDGSNTWPVKDFFDRLQETPAAINVASYVGHNTIRATVMGDNFKRRATPAEIEHMRFFVAEGMRAGALGLSSGLEYDPGIYSSSEELIELAKEAGKFGGRYISHIRSEDRWEWQALDEIVRIGREARIPVQVSHMKLGMIDWWGQSRRFLDVLERARREGVEITGDVYPYESWHSDLGVLFPKRDFTNRKTAEYALAHVAPADGLIITSYSPEPELVGLSIAQIAERKGMQPADTLMDLIARSRAPGSRESVMGRGMSPDDVAALIAWPEANICSDGSLASRHPRGAGAFTKILRVYVREQKLLSLEEAIHKMSGLAAAHMGFTDRGLIKPGNFADLVLLDPAQVADRSTITEPGAISTGISKVWVNGVVVVNEGEATGAHPGQVVRRK